MPILNMDSILKNICSLDSCQEKKCVKLDREIRKAIHVRIDGGAISDTVKQKRCDCLLIMFIKKLDYLYMFFIEVENSPSPDIKDALSQLQGTINLFSNTIRDTDFSLINKSYIKSKLTSINKGNSNLIDELLAAMKHLNKKKFHIVPVLYATRRDSQSKNNLMFRVGLTNYYKIKIYGNNSSPVLFKKCTESFAPLFEEALKMYPQKIHN
ncbi:MAG: hypothetical protein ABSA18_02495 [Dehalococcoidia bacterium]